MLGTMYETGLWPLKLLGQLLLEGFVVGKMFQRYDCKGLDNIK